MVAKVFYEDGKILTKEVDIRKTKYGFIAQINKEELSEGVLYVDFLIDYFVAKTSDAGYFLVPQDAAGGTQITYFAQRPNCQRELSFVHLGCYGYCDGENSILGIVTGMRCDFGLIEAVNDGQYLLYPRFYIDGAPAEEDICVEFHRIRGTDYSSMAKKYREYQINNCGCKPLLERINLDKRLKKASEGISVRIRNAWKSVPSPALFQTTDNEPQIQIGCTFKRTEEIAELCKQAKIKDLEFCLVGWNVGGHDGRYPQIFPAESRLGGDEGLKSLIDKVHNLGYEIVCHTNVTEAYSIADCFDDEYLVKCKDSSIETHKNTWSGGQPFKVCPQRAYELFTTENMEKLRQMGFEGINYIDVITIVALPKCYDDRHKTTRKQSAEWYRKIMRLSKQYFGGFSSEAGFDFAASDLDYVLYTNFHIGKEKNILCDEYIPFFQLVYHGIIMYNPCTFTLNYPTKEIDNRLKFFEYGGRPLAVFNANFAAGRNWMGNEDLFNDTDENLKKSIEALKIMSDDYEYLRPVRYAYMDDHKKISDGVFSTLYSNGVEIIVDYNEKTVSMSGKPMLDLKKL